MYYDRSLPDEYVELLRNNSFFLRLIELVRSPWGSDSLAHIEFRRSNGIRRGAVKVYLGRSSVLEIRAKADGTFGLQADARYEPVAANLFGRSFDSASLENLTTAVEEYLFKVRGHVGAQFTEGEGRVHAGFVRRYGLNHRADDPFVAVDKEIRVGFSAKTETAAFESGIRHRFGEVHRELDSLGILARGDIALIELKKEKESIETGAMQAATHVLTFQTLLAAQQQTNAAFDLAATINVLLEQKVLVDLLPEHACRGRPHAQLVPVIAAPDRRTDWQTVWTAELQPVRVRHGDLLSDLRLWRLSDDGEVVEEAIV